MQTLFRSTLLIAVILATLLVPGVTTAQEPLPDCTPALLAERFAAIGDQIAQAEARLTDNDLAGALRAFDAAAALVDDVRATCGADTAASMTVPATPIAPTSALCNAYPQYCVPFIGGPMVDDIPNEAPGVRPVLSGPSNIPHILRGTRRTVGCSSAIRTRLSISWNTWISPARTARITRTTRLPPSSSRRYRPARRPTRFA